MDNYILFSKRRALERKAIEWCAKNNAEPNSFNLVTALCSMGLIGGNAILTNAMHSDGEGRCLCDDGEAGCLACGADCGI